VETNRIRRYLKRVANNQKVAIYLAVTLRVATIAHKCPQKGTKQQQPQQSKGQPVCAVEQRTGEDRRTARSVRDGGHGSHRLVGQKHHNLLTR
jgi:hypothetical protein